MGGALMARKRGRATGRSGPSFLALQHRMLDHPRFLALSGRAIKTLLYLARQFRGKNNGDLQATWTLARSAGFKSSANLRSALQELEDAGFIVRTRQGGRNSCNLYALTWQSIDDCGGKLDVPPTRVASNEWLRGSLSSPPADQRDPPVDQSVAKAPDLKGSVIRPWISQGTFEQNRDPPADTFIDIYQVGEHVPDAPSEPLSSPSEAPKRGRPRAKPISTHDDAV
jgi:hypothetical protein